MNRCQRRIQDSTDFIDCGNKAVVQVDRTWLGRPVTDKIWLCRECATDWLIMFKKEQKDQLAKLRETRKLIRHLEPFAKKKK